jgi:hypothetical protein
MKFKGKLIIIHKHWLAEGSPKKLSQVWKISVGRIFLVESSKIQTLDPLFQLGTLPEESFKLVLEIICLHFKGTLKGQKATASAVTKDISISFFMPLQGTIYKFIKI